MSQETVMATDAPDEPLEAVQSESDATDATEQSQVEEPTAQAQPEESATPEPEDEDLRSQEFYEALSPEQKKQQNRYFTQRTQKLAAQEREVEQHRQIIEALRTDPKGTVEAMARQVGIQVQEAAPAATQQALASVQQRLEASFGPELTQQLLPAFQELAAQVTQQQLQPIQQWQESLEAKAARERSESALTELEHAYPDWKKHETAMAGLAKRIRPGEGMTEVEWMKHLYRAATADLRDGDAARKASDRINKSARAAESPASGVPTTRVSPGPPQGGFKNLNEAISAAFAAARRGETWAP